MLKKNIAILWKHTAESKDGNSCDCESESSVWGNSGGGGTGGICSFGNGGTKCPLIDKFSITFSTSMK